MFSMLICRLKVLLLFHSLVKWQIVIFDILASNLSERDELREREMKREKVGPIKHEPTEFIYNTEHTFSGDVFSVTGQFESLHNRRKIK